MSVADKLTAVAENVPKVYEAGQKSVAVIATAKGNPAVLDYVHPTEHELAVTLSRRNLLDIERCRAASEWGGKPWELTVEKEGDVVHVYGTINDTSSGSYISLVVIDTPQTELCGKGYVIQPFNVHTNKAMTGQECNFRTYGLRTEGENVIAITIIDAPAGGEIDYRFRVGVSEAPQTTYTPYIPDFSGVSVTRYGKNLFNINCERSYPDPMDTDGAVPRKFINGTYVVGMTRNNYISEPQIKSFAFENNSLTLNVITSYFGILFPLKLSPNTRYTFSCKTADVSKVTLTCSFYDEDGNYLSNLWSTNANYISFTTDDCGNMLLGLLPTVKNEDITFTDVQLELGDTVTEYKPYIQPQTVTANADGTVDGFVSVAPTSVLTTDEGVIINAEYWLDAGRKVEEMETALLDLGGSL